MSLIGSAMGGTKMKLFRYVVYSFLAIIPGLAHSSEQVESPSLESDIRNVRVFVGFTISKEGKLVAPTVVTLIESGEKIDCRFVTFPDMPVALKDVVLIPPKGERIKFGGEAKDPRGWTVTWTAELVGDKMAGTFKQPYDEGRFKLLEAYK